MDLELILLMGAAVVGIIVGLLHLVGYVPPRYRKMLKEVQSQTAESISRALQASLARFLPEDGSEAVLDPNVALAPLTARLDALPHAIGEELTAALGRAQADAMKAMESVGIPPEVTGAMGGTITQSNRKMGELKNAIGEGLLGPYGSLLQQFLPPLYDYLVDNPDMVVQALEMPVVQGLIKKASAMAGNLRSGINESGGISPDNPFTRSLRP